MNERAAFVLIGAVFVGALLVGINQPFTRHREGVCAQYAIMAGNHVRLGYGTTHLASYEIADVDPAMYGDWRQYCYPNRPFLSVLATSLWYQVFGDREWVLRLSLILAALGSWMAFVALARKLVEPRLAVLAAGLFAFNPMFWYFSIVAVPLTYALAFSMAAWACRVRWEEGRRFRVWTVVFLALACESDWTGYYATLSIALDALLEKRRGLAAGFFAIGVSCFSLHLLHLSLIDPRPGRLVGSLMQAGASRSVQSLPGPLTYLVGESREIALYFTVGMTALAIAGLRRLPRRIWLFAILGLDEILFIRWGHEHDFLTYPLAPFFVLAAVHGVAALRAVPRGRLVAAGLLALAAAQSLWITGDRLTRRGASEVQHLAGLAIREGTRPDDRVLLTIDDVRQFTPYYARRYTAGVELGGPELMVHPTGARFPLAGVGDLERYFGDYSVVLVGDPGRAAAEIPFFRGKEPPPEFRFLGVEHPLRRSLEARAVSKEIRGAFVLYRLR